MINLQILELCLQALFQISLICKLCVQPTDLLSSALGAFLNHPNDFASFGAEANLNAVITIEIDD